MNSAISTSVASVAVTANSIQILNGQLPGDQPNSIDKVRHRTERRYRWQNTPGIRVSLQNPDQQPQINEYRRLRSDGRRKNPSSEIESEIFNRTIEARTLDKGSVNPRTKIILDRFIQQMGGAEQSLSIGSYINTSV